MSTVQPVFVYFSEGRRGLRVSWIVQQRETKAETHFICRPPNCINNERLWFSSAPFYSAKRLFIGHRLCMTWLNVSNSSGQNKSQKQPHTRPPEFDTDQIFAQGHSQQVKTLHRWITSGRLLKTNFQLDAT